MQEGQIDGQGGTNVRIENNILVSPSNGVVNERDSGVTYDYNVYSGGNVAVRGAHDIVGDPRFANAPGNDFGLQAGSPAIDSASAALPIATDHAGDLAHPGPATIVAPLSMKGPQPLRLRPRARWC